MAEDKKYEGVEKMPRWVLEGLNHRLGACEFAIRQQAKNPTKTTAYFLREMSKQLVWLRELVRAHGKVKTEFDFDLPPHGARKPKNIKLQLGKVDDDA